MASIHREIDLPASAEQVWDALRDVGALHTRLAPGFIRDVTLEPGARLVTFDRAGARRHRQTLSRLMRA